MPARSTAACAMACSANVTDSSGVAGKRRLASAIRNDQHDFETVVVIQMDVQGGNYGGVIVMLQLGELFGKQARVVVVDQGHRAEDFGVRRLPGLLDQFIADQVAEGFRTVGISALGDELVELLQEVAADGYANSTEIGHTFIRI
jgi:hypothetical protein